MDMQRPLLAIAFATVFCAGSFATVGCDGGETSDDPVVVDTGTDDDAAVDGGPDRDATDTISTDGDAQVDVDTGPSCDPGETYSADRGACLCDGKVCGAEARCETETGTCVTKAEAKCLDNAAWDGSTEAFVDASEAWNLPSINAHGVRISVTDLEGDGWPDLAVRKVQGKPNTQSKRTVWLLRNTGNGTFEDVTESSGFLQRRSGNGSKGRPVEVVVWGDVDNDGDLDAYTGFNRRLPNEDGEPTAEIMLNQGDGTFEFAPAKNNDVRRDGHYDMPAGASFLDYNRDGNLDLWVTQYAARGMPALQDQLYKGRGDGTFERVTEEVGIDSKAWRNASTDELNQGKGHSRAWSSNACDVNGDGIPELLAGSYGRAPNHLWRGSTADSGKTTYENVSVDSNVAYDDDQDWTDNQRARCYCKSNENADGCEGVPDPDVPCEGAVDPQYWSHGIGREAFRLGGNTGTITCGDLDNDGDLDLLTNEIRHSWAGTNSDPSEILYNKDGEFGFERPGRESTGLTRSHAYSRWDEGDITGGMLDFDNDRQLDIYIGSTDYPGTRGLLYHQLEDGTFEKVGPEVGIDHKSSHGIALADFDRDGDVDVVVGHSDTRCQYGNHCYPDGEHYVRLFENQAGQDRNWLQLKLEGADGTNRSAIGARITVQTGDTTQVREVGGGYGHYGIQHDLTQHIGLGDACEARVTVRWPDDALSERTFVLKSGHRYRLKQGASPVVADRDH